MERTDAYLCIKGLPPSLARPTSILPLCKTRVKAFPPYPSTIKKPKYCPIFGELTRNPWCSKPTERDRPKHYWKLSLGIRSRSTSNTSPRGSTVPLFDRRCKCVSSSSKSDIGPMCAR
ncbi:hypothetical protein HPB49_007865 [Dermacentor silvarum]|uniref:Uncharacterized protein n=1 Tax=Dermacentor silvarum TaxID=543639 RepID=A0ACB8C8A7_DERSI|nr:hypothetical protein HPB49_007865 [Dermacentor silvarum]